MFLFGQQLCHETEAQFQKIELERKALTLLLVSDCEEIHKHEYNISFYDKYHTIGDEEYSPSNVNENGNNHIQHLSSSYVTKLKSLVTLICFSERKHKWESTAPFWNDKRKRILSSKKFNYRKHVDVSNKTLLETLDSFNYTTAWQLPSFNVHHVGSYSCVTKPGLEQSRIHLYTEDHRHPAVYKGEIHKETAEYVPVTIPCIPAHPLVDIKLYKKNETRLPYGIVYDPKSGYSINEPASGTHNGTYLCVFTDNSGKKVSHLITHLQINSKKKTKTYLQGINIKKVNISIQVKSFSSSIFLTIVVIFKNF